MFMPKIVIADPMEAEVIEKIKQLGSVELATPADLLQKVADADVLIVRSATIVTRELLSAALKVKIVARAGVGLDTIDVKACEERGIKIINTPGASSAAVAELAIGMMFALARKIPFLHAKMKNGVWDKKNGVGIELAGKTLGLVGFGKIAQEVAKRARALGMEVIAYTDYGFQSELARAAGLEELLAKSDFVSIHVPMNEKTKGMIGAEHIAKMKKGAFIVNTARGGIVEEGALFDACKSGMIAGAALDVYSKEPYDEKLLELENVVFTPHVGGSTKEAQMRIGEEMVAKLKQALA
jgi:D-3-phosphoglycerate dehydrogenase